MLWEFHKEDIFPRQYYNFEKATESSLVGKSVPITNLVNEQLKRLVPALSYVFPDIDIHMHIQVSWS